MSGPHLIEIAVEARSRADAQKLVEALPPMHIEMPSVEFSLEPESGQIRVKAYSEEELAAAVSRLSLVANVNTGVPQIAYREAPTRMAEVDYTHKRQMAGTGQFARVKLRIEPAEHVDPTFASDIVGDSVPPQFIPGVERGVRSVLSSGPLLGFPVIKTRVMLLDGAYHDTDSSDLAFEIAARAAMRQAADRLYLRIHEPFMRVEITCPEEFAGYVIGGLNSRRGEIEGQSGLGEILQIVAVAPLANLFGYRKALTEMTLDSATLTMAFDSYRAVPKDPPDDDVFPPAVGKRA